jgi:2-polyprenyl-3-methyl-5-hydroxy-6-metoxy-1,4-benzoquinol methylase
MTTHPRPDGLRDTYDRIADDWARDHEGDTWWRECTAAFAALLPNGAHLLDAGCGSGQKAKFFQDRGVRVIGIDFSEKLLEIARQTATASDFRLLDLRDIRTLAEEFDGVFARASLLHIPKAEAFSVIEGMVSRLVPRGLPTRRRGTTAWLASRRIANGSRTWRAMSPSIATRWSRKARDTRPTCAPSC